MKISTYFPASLGCACLLLVAGCGGSTKASAVHATLRPRATPTAPPTIAAAPTLTVAPVPTSTPTSAAVATSTATSQPSTPTSPAPAPAAAPQVTGASLTPSSAPAGATLQARVQVRGRASRVELYLASGPGGGAPVTFTLSPLGSGVWAASGTAPSSPGSYHYSVGVYNLAGQRTIADDDSWNVTIAGGPPQTGPQPLPADVPLSPPFSYGSPQTAVFSAEGRTVSGSEVVSNARPDVSAAVVAQWYETHFPRAGWTVDQGTIPAAGAGSFSIAATSGNRVCVAAYSGGVVQVFYGSFSS